jgi:hypothetical protein
MQSNFFHHPQFLHNDIFLLLIFLNFGYFIQWFFYVWNNFFKWFWTEGGHKQFTIIKSLAACAQKQEVNDTNIDLWR